MDFKKLSLFVLIFGALVFLYGAYQYTSNKPLAMPTATDNPFTSINNFYAVGADNLGRADERASAKTKMILGGVIIFIGGAMKVSSIRK